jgi:hypothetical protein
VGAPRLIVCSVVPRSDKGLDKLGDIKLGGEDDDFDFAAMESRSTGSLARAESSRASSVALPAATARKAQASAQKEWTREDLMNRIETQAMERKQVLQHAACHAHGATRVHAYGSLSANSTS